MPETYQAEHAVLAIAAGDHWNDQLTPDWLHGLIAPQPLVTLEPRHPTIVRAPARRSQTGSQRVEAVQGPLGQLADEDTYG
jgi:hypothetical protein